MSEIKTPLRGMMAPFFSSPGSQDDFLWEDDDEELTEPPLPHRDHERRCPPLPEEGVRATAEDSSLSDIEAAERAEAEAQAAHFARWRQAIVDAEVLRRPDWLD